MKQRFFPLLLAMALSACSLTPVLTTPATPVPACYPVTQETDQQGSVADLAWRTMFPDPRLQSLIELALSNIAISVWPP